MFKKIALLVADGFPNADADADAAGMAPSILNNNTRGVTHVILS